MSIPGAVQLKDDTRNVRDKVICTDSLGGVYIIHGHA
tara:strand:+ start:1111 stop:1221 length:111 start_codon:yes stop_codon:yes gene_type:complete